MMPSALDRTLHALADPTRRAVIERLSEAPASISVLARRFDMALPSFMQHMAVLEADGLVRTSKTGRVRTCEINREPLNEMSRWLDSQRRQWNARLDRLDAHLKTMKQGEKP